MWQDWVNGILGIWIIISAYVGFAMSTLQVVLLITGIVIAILGFWGAYSKAA